MFFPTKGPLSSLFVLKCVCLCAHVPRRTVHVRQKLLCVCADMASQSGEAVFSFVLPCRSCLIHADHVVVCISSLSGDFESDVNGSAAAIAFPLLLSLLGNCAPTDTHRILVWFVSSLLWVEYLRHVSCAFSG